MEKYTYLNTLNNHRSIDMDEQELTSFEFAVDRKTTVWERTRF